MPFQDRRDIGETVVHLLGVTAALNLLGPGAIAAPSGRAPRTRRKSRDGRDGDVAQIGSRVATRYRGSYAVGCLDRSSGR